MVAIIFSVMVEVHNHRYGWKKNYFLLGCVCLLKFLSSSAFISSPFNLGVYCVLFIDSTMHKCFKLFQMISVLLQECRNNIIIFFSNASPFNRNTVSRVKFQQNMYIIIFVNCFLYLHISWLLSSMNFYVLLLALHVISIPKKVLVSFHFDWFIKCSEDLFK